MNIVKAPDSTGEHTPIVCILSMPRSGSSWVGKLMDSNPNVRYLHEPDSDLKPPTTLPQFSTETLTDSQISEAINYGSMLLKLRSERTTTSVPQFPKSYRPPISDQIYRLRIFATKAFHRAGLKIRIPREPISKNSNEPVEILKSISLLSRARFVRAAFPHARIIHLIRHPCGYVSSRLNGERLGAMSGDSYTDAISKTPYCINSGITKSYLESLTKEEQFTYGWAAINEFALDAFSADNGVMMVSYERLCHSTLEVLAEIHSFTGLSIEEQTRDFLKSSTSYENTRYYSVKKDPVVACTRWETELTSEQIENILNIAKLSQSGRFAIEQYSASRMLIG